MVSKKLGVWFWLPILTAVVLAGAVTVRSEEVETFVSGRIVVKFDDSAHPDLDGAELRARLKGTAPALGLLLPQRQVLDAGLVDPVAGIRSQAGPRAVLRELEIDRIATNRTDGDGNPEPGEEVFLLLELENGWEPAWNGTVELVSDDPLVRAVSPPQSYTSWPRGGQFFANPQIVIDAATPRYHLARLRVVINGDGYHQEIRLPLEINGSQTFIIHTQNSQEEFTFVPVLAADGAGRFVSLWGRHDRLRERSEVMARLFDERGVSLGEAFRLHPEDGWDRNYAVVARNEAGTWVAAWRAGRQIAESEWELAVEFRRFQGDGTPLEDIVRVTTVTTVDSFVQEVAVAIADDGEVAVAWSDYALEQACSIQGQRFGADGQARGEIFCINSTADGSFAYPSLAFNRNGELLAAWRAHLGRTPEGEHDINAFAQLFAATGLPVGVELRLNEERGRWSLAPTVAGGAAGFVVLWDWCDRPRGLGGTGECSVRARRLANDGTFLTGELNLQPIAGVDVSEIDVVIDDQGTFAAAWESCPVSAGSVIGCEIRAREFGSLGVPTSALHRIDWMNPLYTPAIARAAEGYVLTWENSGVGPFHIYGQFFLPQPLTPAERCAAFDTSLCLWDERFEITVSWRDFAGNTGTGRSISLTDKSGYFWFFDRENVELVIKVLDGRAINGRWWVFYGAMSNVEYTITVTDTETGSERVYHNPSGRFASTADTMAF